MRSPLSAARAGARRLLAGLPQTGAAGAIARTFTRGRLRILAFHGVPDQAAFARVLDVLIDGYTPVSGADVDRALTRRSALPPLSCWVTFDDGLPSTLAAGELLAARGISATAFVCPSVLDTNRYLWFQAWHRCQDLGLLSSEELAGSLALARLKSAPDAERAAATQRLERRLEAAGDVAPPQADQGMLERWIGQGHEMGNHSWDHPMLDRCSDEQQRDQVVRAHSALLDRGFDPRFLAYPNGNGAPAAARAAAEIGYAGSVVFDHRLARLDGPPHQLSRLRIDSQAAPRRAASILSGAHSSAMHLVGAGQGGY